MRTLKLLLLAVCWGLPIPCPGQSPAKTPEAGMLPEWHGIALFKARSHHLDLMMALVGDEPQGNAERGDDRGKGKEPAQDTPEFKRLRAELCLRPEQVPWLMVCLGVIWTPELPGLEKGDPEIDFDALENRLLFVTSVVLNDKQQRRFEELGCQFAGPMALRLNLYAKRLGLSPAQRKTIGGLVDTYMDKAAETQRASFVFRTPEQEKQLKAVACELDEKILAVLTDKQRTMWKKLLGKKFDWMGMVEG